MLSHVDAQPALMPTRVYAPDHGDKLCYLCGRVETMSNAVRVGNMTELWAQVAIFSIPFCVRGCASSNEICMHAQSHTLAYTLSQKLA
jgi:hypothetical protein